MDRAHPPGNAVTRLLSVLYADIRRFKPSYGPKNKQTRSTTVPHETAQRILSEKDPVLRDWRIWLANQACSLPSDLVRAPPGRTSISFRCLESRVHQHISGKPTTCSLCGEIHNEAQRGACELWHDVQSARYWAQHGSRYSKSTRIKKSTPRGNTYPNSDRSKEVHLRNVHVRKGYRGSWIFGTHPRIT